MLHSQEMVEYRKDWPQRKVVLIQSSVKLTGSLRHSVTRMIAIAASKMNLLSLLSRLGVNTMCHVIKLVKLELRL